MERGRRRGRGRERKREREARGRMCPSWWSRCPTIRIRPLVCMDCPFPLHGLVPLHRNGNGDLVGDRHDACNGPMASKKR
jgi:hypothetical protein